MDDKTAVTAQKPASEALSTWALFLSMIAIVGFAMSVGAFGLDRIGLAVSAGLLSVVSFTASIFFFSADADEFTDS
jgi:flagellar biogenesis protein FliO